MKVPLVAPGQAMRPDMDIVLATHNLIKETGKIVHFHHVEGHVDKKHPGEEPTRLETYNQLCDKGFQNHETGNLFFPAYMYMYNPEHEYEVEKEILDIKSKL